MHPLKRFAVGITAFLMYKFVSGWLRNRSSSPLVVVFSKDRAAQLDLLLKSYSMAVCPPPSICVLYSASDDRHYQAYQTVLAEHRAIVRSAIRQSSFKKDLLRLLQGSTARSLMFLVDDIVFLRPVEGSTLTAWNPYDGILSLRLGSNITRSFNRGCQLDQPPLESMNGNKEEMLRWKWNRGMHDWRLALSLDGNLLPLRELNFLLKRCAFRAPNSLEAALGQFRFVFDYGTGYCWRESRIVNLAINSVKSEDFNFPHAGGDPNVLLTGYLAGGRLSAQGFSLEAHDSCHMNWQPEMLHSYSRTK